MFKKLAAVIAVFTAVVLMMGAASQEQVRGVCSIVQTSYAPQGETFTVDLVLSSNPGFKSLQCSIRYSTSELEFVEASDAELLQGYYCVKNGSTIQLTWLGEGQTNVEVNGVLATLTFRVINVPVEGSLIYNTVTARTSGSISVPVDGATSIVYSGTETSDPAPEEVPEPDVPEFEVTGEVTDEPSETVDENTETVPDETEAPVTTTEEVTTTRATTTRATTQATTTRRRSTTTEPVTTPEPETTTEPTTTEPPVTTTEPTTTPEPVTTTEPTTTSETTTEAAPTAATHNAFAEVYDDGVDNKAANSGTLLVALIMLALTAVVVIAIEYYKRNR